MKLIEGNYTKIPNEVLEGLFKVRLNATQQRILLTIIRYTYGFNRAKHQLSVTFIAHSTKSNIQAIKRGLKELIEMRIVKVIKEATFSSSRILSINEDIESWLIKEYQDNEMIPGNSNDTTPGNSNDTLPGNSNDTQETKKQIYKQTEPDEIEDYFNKIWSLYPNKKGKSKVSAEQKVKLYNEVPLNKMIKAISSYKQETQGRDPKYIKEGGNFFNGHYMDYLPQEVKVIPQPRERKILDYDERIRQLQEEEERRYQVR